MKRAWGLVLTSCILFVCHGTALAAGQCEEALPAPDALREQLRERGSFMVASELFMDRAAWTCVEARLSAADPVWFVLWQELRVDAPSGPAKSAIQAVGYALKRDPRLVFDKFGTGPCEVVDELQLGGAEKALVEMEARREALHALRDWRYQRSRDECLSFIDEAIAQVRRRRDR